MADTGSPRVCFIDRLRILAVLLLFPFHTLRVFDAGDPFYVKASVESEWIGSLLWFISVWHMPLLFFLAGCSTYFALRKRTGGQYTWERVKRLLVPFIFGFFVLVPPQTWYGGRSNSGYMGSFGHYLIGGDFLQWNIQDDGDYFGGFGIGHLWFILFLLIISLVAIPLILWGARGRGVRRMQAFSRLLARPVWWSLAVVILFVGMIAPEIPGGPIIYYLFIFLLGFVAVGDRRFMETAERYRIPALVAGLALAVFWVLSADFRDSLPYPGPARAGLAILGAAGTWLSIMGMLGFGKRYLDRTSRTQQYLAESSYPVYIIHQTVIVTLGFYVVQLAAPRPVQWLALIIASVLGTFCLYEIGRRVGVLRFLLSMKARPRAPKPIAEPVRERD
jgi:glucans biosynthesis protein C